MAEKKKKRLTIKDKDGSQQYVKGKTAADKYKTADKLHSKARKADKKAFNSIYWAFSKKQRDKADATLKVKNATGRALGIAAVNKYRKKK